MQVTSATKGRHVRRICTVQIYGAALALSFLASATPVRAQALPSLPPESQRTVEWYATHPVERNQVRRICLNDPGHLENSPDCINAKRGDLAAAAAASRRDAGPDDPDFPAYWTRRPNERRFKLGYCQRMTPEHQARASCGPAMQSLLMEQQGRIAR